MPTYTLSRFSSDTHLAPNNLCSRCGGSVLLDRDVDGPFFQCQSCGREIPFMFSPKPMRLLKHPYGKRSSW